MAHANPEFGIAVASRRSAAIQPRERSFASLRAQIERISTTPAHFRTAAEQSALELWLTHTHLRGVYTPHLDETGASMHGKARRGEMRLEK